MRVKQSRHEVACIECRDLSGIRAGLAKQEMKRAQSFSLRAPSLSRSMENMME